MSVTIEPFPEAGPELVTISGGEAPNSFVNADARDGVVGGKNSLTVAEAASQLLRGEPGWGPALNVAAAVTYAFRASAPGAMPSDTAGFSQFTAAQIAQTEKALQSWSDVANVTFVRVGAGTTGAIAYSDNAAMLFGNYSTGESGSAAFAYYPGNTQPNNRSGDVWINSSLGYNATPTASNYGGMVLVHEIGHAIGLAHPSEYNVGGSATAITYNANAQYYEDSRQYTVMSYFGEGNTGAAFNGAYASSPLLDDIAAAQMAYGANMTTRTGDTVYGFNSTAEREWFSATSSSAKLVFAAWDAGGTDTFDFSGFKVAQTIDLREGFFSSVGGLVGNVTIAVGAVIENAIGGSAADTINGNAVANRITGGAGNDILDGDAGLDTAAYAGKFASYAVSALATGGWQVKDTAGTDGSDSVINIESLQFSDRVVALVDSRVASAMASVLRLQIFSTGADAMTKSIAGAMASGTSYADALGLVTKAAVGSSAVAALSYQFFTSKTPTATGMDYLVDPNGSNPNNLNSAYYQSFDTINRFINFSVNLGKNGEGASAFNASYGSLSLFDATKKAYATIFGATPTDQKVHDLVDAQVGVGGVTMTRADYLAYYGQDGVGGLGTKAAMVGFLLAAAETEHLGVYARSADAFFADQLTHNVYGVDLIGAYAKPEYNLI